MKNISEIELMYFENCPSWKEAFQHLSELINDLNLEMSILLKNIETNEEAAKYEFPGSPTIKINGKDIFPTNRSNFALGCRIYDTPEGYRGSPTRKMIEEALESSITS
jgi:hypothetical protein